MNKIYPDAASALDGVLQDGMLIASGGFGLCGIPELLLAAIRDAGVKDLTFASNNAGVDDFGIGILLQTKQVKKMISSYVGDDADMRLEQLCGFAHHARGVSADFIDTEAVLCGNSEDCLGYVLYSVDVAALSDSALLCQNCGNEFSSSGFAATSRDADETDISRDFEYGPVHPGKSDLQTLFCRLDDPVFQAILHRPVEALNKLHFHDIDPCGNESAYFSLRSNLIIIPCRPTRVKSEKLRMVALIRSAEAWKARP